MPSWPDASPPSTAGSRRGVWIGVAAVVLALFVGGVWWLSARAGGRAGATTAAKPGAEGTPSTAAALADTSAHAPAGTRVVVRVVNATGIRGLARRATLWLRDFGYDVVDFDSAPKLARQETIIEVHTGHDAWGERVRKAMGVGRVTTRPDTSRYVDLTVFVGSDWQPPAEPLRP